MLVTIKAYFLLFIIYSVMGWLLEITCKLIEYKRFINRGFLIGPYCPIYGVGAVLITLLLNRYSNDPFVLFIMTILLCGTLEYLTSYILEKLFNLRWWDYSRRKYNINGRICLDTLVPFGIFGLLVIYVLNPFFFNIINYIVNNYLNVCFYGILSIFIIDNIFSFIAIINIKTTTKNININNKNDSTEEITQKVKEILIGKSYIHRRLINAYPKIEMLKIKVKEKITQTKKIIDTQIDKTKSELDKTRDIIQEKIKKNK